jgi:hypothetical protein
VPPPDEAVMPKAPARVQASRAAMPSPSAPRASGSTSQILALAMRSSGSGTTSVAATLRTGGSGDRTSSNVIPSPQTRKETPDASETDAILRDETKRTPNPGGREKPRRDYMVVVLVFLSILALASLIGLVSTVWMIMNLTQ